MEITKDIYYVGVNDHEIDLFEGQYIVPNGMAYNSYIILDEKIAVMDTVDINFTSEWLEKISKVLDGRQPDYLVIQHMEPDHSANIKNFMKVYPNTKIVGNNITFKMMDQFFEFDQPFEKLIVKNGDQLNLGTHLLTFILAPMVHWPEVIFTYDAKDKILFSADAFGKFGANDIEEDWVDEARRYYFGIVGKYGVQVQNVLDKINGFDIEMICSLHGPVLKENIHYYLSLYQTWSSYQAEDDDIVIAYSSIYGNTKQAVIYLYNRLIDKSYQVKVYDLAREDMSKVVAEAFRCRKLILATTTYNADIFPCMKEFINKLKERNYQNRIIGFIENGSWAPMANRIMKKMLEDSKDMHYLENNVTIHSALKEDTKEMIEKMAIELIK